MHFRMHHGIQHCSIQHSRHPRGIASIAFSESTSADSWVSPPCFCVVFIIQSSTYRTKEMSCTLGKETSTNTPCNNGSMAYSAAFMFSNVSKLFSGNIDPMHIYLCTKKNAPSGVTYWMCRRNKIAAAAESSSVLVIDFVISDIPVKSPFYCKK